jgi:acyl carrier protein/NAD(P)-dependent dehydrogenase (short-subunit alcohol dehydrogenase family)
MEAAGARVLVLQANVPCRDEVARVLAAIDADLPPLGGVIHAAGVLDDGVLSQQHWARFETVLGPKLGGAWHLHTLTAERPLDCFVLFSAGAALIGAPGQSNYAAANAALDALAHWRRARGLPALSINWGPWAEVGMAAALSDEHRRRLAEQGLQSLTPAEGLRALELALASGAAQLAAMPADWDTFGHQFEPQAAPSLFRDLIGAARHDTGERATAASISAARLAATPPSLRRGVLLRHVREQAAHVLGLATVEATPADRPLSELGMDSLMAVELRNVLGRSLDLALPSTALFDYPTVGALTDYLLAQLLTSPEVAAGSEAATTDGRADLDVDALSEAEAEALLLAELAR